MNEIKERWQRVPKAIRIVGMVLLGVVAAVFLAFVFGFLIKILWNWLMPELFNLKEITYWQAFGIAILARLLFGSFGGDHDSGSKSSRKKKKKQECEDEEEHSRDCWKHWEHYDEWWQKEGRKAFDDFVGKQREENSKEQRDEHSKEQREENSKEQRDEHSKEQREGHSEE